MVRPGSHQRANLKARSQLQRFKIIFPFLLKVHNWKSWKTEPEKNTWKNKHELMTFQQERIGNSHGQNGKRFPTMAQQKMGSMGK